MNPRTATIIIIVGFALLGVGMSLYTNPLKTHDTNDLWINAFDADGIAFYFSSGDKVECMVTVRGGDERIVTSVENLFGDTVYERMIDGGENFIVNTEPEGVYSFSFLNLEEESGKTVYLTLGKQVLGEITVVGLLIFSVFLIIGGIYENYQYNKRRGQLS